MYQKLNASSPPSPPLITNPRQYPTFITCCNIRVHFLSFVYQAALKSKIETHKTDCNVDGDCQTCLLDIKEVSVT